MKEQRISGNSHIAEVKVGAIQLGWIRLIDETRSEVKIWDDTVSDRGGWGKLIFTGTIAELIDKLNKESWEGVSA